MKKFILSLLVVLSFTVKAQDDTLLFNTFNLFDLDTIVIEGDTFVYVDIQKSNWANLQLQGWQTYSNQEKLAEEITEGPKSTNYWLYDSVSWLNWHVDLYALDSVDTVVVSPDSTRYDTVADYGLVSYSWLETPSKLQNAIMTPAVWLTGDVSKLSWESKPIQGPRYQDGYKVYVLRDEYKYIDRVPFETIDYDFAMKQLDVSGGPVPRIIKSIVELNSLYDFIPEDGTNHDNYEFKYYDDVVTDSTVQQPYMQRFEIDLSEYQDEYVRIVFLHDSYDNYGIVLDNVLITGIGSIGTEEVSKFSLKSYPNPVNNQVYFEFPQGESNGLVELFDLSGRSVLLSDYEIYRPLDVSSLVPGQYLVTVKTSKGVYSHKFIKI